MTIWNGLSTLFDIVATGNLFSLAIITAFVFYACCHVIEFAVPAVYPASGYANPTHHHCKRVGIVPAALFAVLYFLHVIDQTNWQDPVSAMALCTRCTLGALLVYAATSSSVAFVHGTARLHRPLWRSLKNYFSALRQQLSAPEPEPEPQCSAPAPPPEPPPPQLTPEERLEKRLNDAKRIYEKKLALLQDAHLDELEIEVIQMQLKQKYLAKIRDAIQQSE